MQLLLHTIGGESVSETVLHLPSACEFNTDNGHKSTPVLFMIPGVEGTANVLKTLAKNLKFQTFCLQCGYEDTGDTIQEMALSLVPNIEKNLPQSATFFLLGYSFGGLLALEIALYLEQKGWEGLVYLVDSSPQYLKNMYMSSLGTNEEEFDVKLLCGIWDIIVQQNDNSEATAKLVKEITPLETYKEKLDHFLTFTPPTNYSLEHIKNIGMSSYTRLKALGKYEWSHKETIKSKIVLLRPATISLIGDKDYGLSKICEKTVDVCFVAGNHVTVLDNEDTANIINSYIVVK